MAVYDCQTDISYVDFTASPEGSYRFGASAIVNGTPQGGTTFTCVPTTFDAGTDTGSGGITGGLTQQEFSELWPLLLGLLVGGYALGEVKRMFR